MSRSGSSERPPFETPGVVIGPTLAGQASISPVSDRDATPIGQDTGMTRHFTGRVFLCGVFVWLILGILVSIATSVAVAMPFPLEPPDTSSPRATLESFMRNTSEGVAAYRRGKNADTILSWFQRAERCLDLSEVSPDRIRSVGIEAGLLIYEVLNRAGLPEYPTIPDAAEVESRELQSWTVPRTDVAIVQVTEGERAGEFLFSPQTVTRALEYYEKVRHLEHKTDYAQGNYEDYVTRPALGMPFLWADTLPAWAKARFLRNPLWKWFAVLVALSLGVILAIVVHRVSAAWDKRFETSGGHWRIGRLAFAVSLVAIPLGLEYFMANVLGVRFSVQTFLSKALHILAFAAAVFVLFALFEVIAQALIASRQPRKRSFDAHLIRVTTRMLAFVVAVALIIQATNFLGWPLGPVLAGLGIGGLAVALAARPTLENVIGGFTLFADRPVRVGDFCRFGNEEGTVEEIGLRSTRIRKRDDTLISIPNADFSNMQVQNNARRRRWLYHVTLGLRYETTPEQLRYVLTKLREMLLRHPKVSPEPLSVRFLGFGAYSLNVEIIAYIRTRDWLISRAICEDINLRVMDIIKEAGTGFAFPSQTNYFAKDAGLDAEHGREAEAQVNSWRAQGKLPFPEFEHEEQARFLDTLDYPPQGSPDYSAGHGTSEDVSLPGTGDSPSPR